MLGFDIGTTRCKIATVDRSGKPTIISNARGEHTTPSAVYLGTSGDILIGSDAREQGIVNPAQFACNFKLDLGGTESLFADGPPFTPTDATAALISTLKQDAEKSTGIQVTEAVATCPANFRDDAKQALLEAFERNGIKVLRLVPEPTAAGYAYALDRGGSTATCLIYDFGGGTFDVSVIKREGDQFTVLATEGVPTLGGNDLSRCIENRVLDEVANTAGTRPTRTADGLFFLDLDQRIEAAKISLGKQKEVPIVVGHAGRQVIVKITQDEFHAAIEQLVGQTLDATDRAVAGSGLTIDRIDRLVMVGGSSRLPYIQDRVADHTRLVPRADIDPEKAIAYGAALACVAEMASHGKTATVRGQVIPAPDLFVQDVTAHSVGCCVADTAGAKKRLVNAVIIPKNTPIPCQKTDHFYLEHEDQTQARVEILQGEADAGRDDCLLIGELPLDNLPKETKRTERIEVRYTIDANGMVTATATDRVSGSTQTVSVDYKKGITPRHKPAAA